jgi:membrane-associated PAP2 superfamily phosphatase
MVRAIAHLLCLMFLSLLSHPANYRFTLVLRFLALCLGLPLVAVLLWDVSGFDRTVIAWYGSAQGFYWKDHYWLTEILHVGARRVCVALALYCVVAIWLPLGWWRLATQRQRVWLACNVWLCAIGIAALKSVSLTSCPWDLAEFGAKGMYVWHFASQLGVSSGLGMSADGGPGRCFPSGHASSFFSFLPAFWLITIFNAQRAKRLLAFWCVAGLALSWIQVMRGAHYPSHLLWTMWLCWAAGTITAPLLRTVPSTMALPQRPLLQQLS